jgi:SAM-dependent methyltransferase
MRAIPYAVLKRWLAPNLRFNQEIYADELDRLVRTETRWLDAGCGHQVFPFQPVRESSLVRRASLAVGTDVAEASLRKHEAIERLVVAGLERLPYRDASFTLVSCNMVAEHLERPEAVFREFARVLKLDGHVVIHTPNAWSYFVNAARVLPASYRQRLAARFDGRPASDVFPTFYRANSPIRIRALLRKVGFHDVRCRMVANDPVIQGLPVLTLLELLFIRATMTKFGRPFRVSMIVTAAR